MGRKILYIVVGISLCMCLMIAAGCRNSQAGRQSDTDTVKENDLDTVEDSGTKDANAAVNEGTETNESHYIAFVQKSLNTYFHRIVNASVQFYTLNEGWKYESAIADYDQIRQNQQMIDFCSKKPDVLIAAPIDKEMINPAIDAVNETGIPVMLVDTESTGGEVALTVNFDNYLAGKMAAREIVRLLTEKYQTPKGVVAHSYGMTGSSAYTFRKKGFEEEISRYPEIKCISGNMKGDAKTAREWLKGVLEDGVEIDAVHCSSDYPARGLAEALQESGKWEKQGYPGHIIFVTIDGDPYAADQIQEGYYDASVVQDAVGYGKILITLMRDYLFQGKEVPEGSYSLEGTYWEKFEVTRDERGLHAVVPPYLMNRENVLDKRNWSYVAREEWGYEYN